MSYWDKLALTFILCFMLYELVRIAEVVAG